jgi:two-component system sensor histidine kinase MtrB
MSLRRRLTIALMVAVGLSAGALAAGSYFVVRHNLLSDSADSSAKQTRVNLRIAPSYLKESPRALLEAFDRAGGGFEAVGIGPGGAFSSSFAVGPLQVPAALREIVRRGDIGYERETVAGTRYLVAGGPSGATQLYFFFSEQKIWHELADLRNILLIGVGVLIVLAALIGLALARRTLRPIARASGAARSLAEGLLETRLPVEGKDEFGVWAQSFNEMAAALESKIEALSAAQARERRFTADVAHELRTPLAALVGEAFLLAEHLDEMPTQARRPAELLIADVRRLRRLVDDLMEISRLDAGVESVRAESVDVGALVAGAVRSRGWDGQVRIDATSVRVTSDPRRLERIVVNLVDNALTHGGKGVTVHVGRDGSGALVEVADRGPGVPPEHLAHLFERFYKADPSRTGSGTGLGLAIAQENAHLLGTRIDASSEPGLGTRFRFKVGLVTEPLPEDDGAVAEVAEDVPA